MHILIHPKEKVFGDEVGRLKDDVWDGAFTVRPVTAPGRGIKNIGNEKKENGIKQVCFVPVMGVAYCRVHGPWSGGRGPPAADGGTGGGAGPPDVGAGE